MHTYMHTYTYIVLHSYLFEPTQKSETPTETAKPAPPIIPAIKIPITSTIPKLKQRKKDKSLTDEIKQQSNKHEYKHHVKAI